MYGMVYQAVDIPSNLIDLLPTGSTSVQLSGTTLDGESCVVDISNSSIAYSIVAVTDSEVAKLQIGLGHELMEIFDTQDDELVVKTYHDAEEQYSRDTKSTATITKNEEDFITSIAVLETEKRLLFGWSTSVDIKCNFTKHQKRIHAGKPDFFHDWW